MSRYVVSAISAYLSLVVAYVNDVDQRVTLFNFTKFRSPSHLDRTYSYTFRFPRYLTIWGAYGLPRPGI